MSSFKELGLSEPILKALEGLKFEKPTDIQAGAIPILLENEKDFIGLAHTGTGKTAAFALPLLDLVDTSEYVTQALVLSPTRELCQQIADQIDLFNKHNRKLKTSVVYGGTAISTQLRDLKRPPHILIATPGRLLDLIERKSAKLGNLKYLVLDEADEMLNMGFKEDIDRILKSAPKERATWLFSATMPSGIRRIVEKYMRPGAEEVKVSAGNETNKNISHEYVVVNNSYKQSTLTRFVDLDPKMRAIVFCRTKAGTQSLAEDLNRKGYNVGALHGDLSQAQRTKVMNQFKANRLTLCICTDVAARGIDVNDLTHVFHYQLPDDTSYYTHRSGRTARAGKSGTSLSIVNKSEIRKIRNLERQLNTQFKEVTPPDASEILELNLSKWKDRLMAAEVPKGANINVISKIATQLSEMEPEAFLEKVLALEVQKLHRTEEPSERGTRGGRDRNERRDRNDRGRDRDRGDRGDRRRDRNDRDPRGKRDDYDRGEKRSESRSSSSNKDKTKFYINVGQRDEISRSDLLNFLIEQTGFSKRDFGNVDMERGHSFFEVDKAKSKQVMGKFRGFSIDGRELRVNPDGDEFGGGDEKPKKKRDSKKGKKESKEKGRRRR
ncbi:MAG: DEAD/DEAH box helicase [Flavobacteriales bacterium]